MIDFACVSSTTPTWSNDPRCCTPGIAATEAEQGKLAADRASSAPVRGVHRYYPFVVEDRGRLGTSALTVVYIFAVLLDMLDELGITVNSKTRKNEKQIAISIAEKKESFIGAKCMKLIAKYDKALEHVRETYPTVSASDDVKARTAREISKQL
eukprot:jgi/Tetstr1/459566/TSEL_004931.t1